MKKLYFTILMVAGTSFVMAQESKTTAEKQEIPKEVIEANAKAYKDKAAEKKEENMGLVSEAGLKKSTAPNKNSSAPSGKTIPGTSDIYAIKASIPGRTVNNKKQMSTKKQVQGLPNTATLAEIKKTIPKN